MNCPVLYPWFMRGALLLFAVLLSACSDNRGKIESSWSPPDTLLFAYPYPGQQEVPPSTKIILRFSAPLETDVLDNIDERFLLSDEDSNALGYQYQVVDNGQGLVLTPEPALLPNHRYQLRIGDDGIGSVSTDAFSNFYFDTAGSQTGFANQTGTGPLSLMAVTPLDPVSLLADIDDARVNDMSTLRMVFNRPLDPASAIYGEQVQLINDQQQLVEASLLLQGRYLVLDPHIDLEAVEHTLIIDGIKSRAGEVLDTVERTFTPKTTLPRETTVIKVGTIGDEQSELTAKLTGQPANQAPVDTFLIGDSTVITLDGALAADLAFVPNFPDAVPLRVPAGSVLQASPVDVNILGEVNAGIDTGNVFITLLSDANGFLIENPFSRSQTAPRYALLTMDAAMTAEGGVANAALSQNLLNVQLVGMAIVENGVLVLDAVAIVEPEILGLEQGSAVLSFRLESFAGLRNPPMPETDSRPLVLQSWSPGDEFQPNARPGDAVILNFNKALDPASVFLDGAIRITADGIPVTREQAPMRHDGATVIIEGSWIRHGMDIQIQLSSLLRDMQGNPLSQDETLSLRLDDLFVPGGNPANLRAPLVASVFPGYPCALTGAVLTGPENTWRNGRCTGGQRSDPLIPVAELYKDFGVRIIFNRNIDPASVNSETFYVERRLDNGSWVREPGQITRLPQRIEFHPDTPWQVGALYRHTLRSVASNPNCGTNAICSPDGAPIQTRQISQSSSTAPAPREGGPNMVNHFRVVGDDQRYSLVSLRSLPVVDVNANLVLDPQEQGAVNNNGVIEAPANHLRLRLAGTGGVITNANLGCSIGQNCPEKAFAFVSTGALQAGPREFDPDVEVNRRLLDGNPATDDWITGAVLANVFPTSLTTTSVFLEARALGLITIGLDTGPLVLRLLNEPGSPWITGYITDTEDGPWFSTTFDLLIDAPELEPRLLIELGHDIRSKRVNNVTLEGPLRFVDDGRLILKVSNPDPLRIPANIDLLGIGLASVDLEVPPLAVDLTFTFLPVKDF